jgi:MoaA/NifB/PqqE/SkfB family radical SAM enzyme
MHKVKSRWNHQDSIKIEWNIGKRCNYDCSYCPSVIHDNHSLHTDIGILKAAVDKLCDLEKPIRLSLTGGEPCVHPRIEELISYIKSKGFWLSITTNGTRKSQWYIDQTTVDQWVFSLHFEYEWIDIMHTIKSVNDGKAHTHILVNVMAHHNHMSEVMNAADLLEFHKINHGIRRIRWTEGDHDLFDDMKYDQNDLDWILNKNSTVEPNTIIIYKDREEMMHANDVIKKHLNQYKNWQCNAGLESLMINWDGDVYRATCRVGGTLGNIYNHSFVLPSSPVICDRNYCTCAADIPLTKELV